MEQGDLPGKMIRCFHRRVVSCCRYSIDTPGASSYKGIMDERKDEKISRNRLEALVDGIFAFAMTLLVTGLVIPRLSKTEEATGLAIRLAEMRAEFISFLVAFFVLASFWHMHNRQFRHVHRVDHGIMGITLMILVCVVLMPFTTNISGDYSGVQIAVTLFHSNMCGLGLFFLLHWLYLTGHPDVTSVAIGSRDASKGVRRCLITPIIAVLGIVISFVSPAWSMAAYLLIIPCVAVVGGSFQRSRRDLP